MNPYVKSVKAQDDYSLLLTFESGEKRVFDIKPYLDKPVFTRLKNIAIFKTARVVSGSVEWQGDIDLSYDTLYLESKVIKPTPSRRNMTRRQRKNLAMTTLPRKKIPKTRVSAKQ